MTEEHILFAVLAFEADLIDLAQLTAACRAWAADRSRPLADLLIERGWIAAEDQEFLNRQLQRKLEKYQNDPHVTLNAVTRGEVRDALREIDDSGIGQSLSDWPSAGPVLIHTIGETVSEASQPASRYTWISEVASGGLGRVWLAKDNDLAREVALKEIRPGSTTPDAVRRLIKEAQITGQLQHPGIVPVYEVNRGNRPFYTMKLVRGATLSKAISRHHQLKRETGQPERQSAQRLMNVFLTVCDAIAFAHSRGVIHRDLKPQNIVLGDFGEAIVLDWGLARQVDGADEESAAIVVTDDALTEATRSGATPGTPAYMSPEQASGRVDLMDQRTDVYGLGAILFEILTGEPPHRRSRSAPDGDAQASPEESTHIHQQVPLQAVSPIAELLHQIANGETPHVKGILDSIPDELDAICARSMARSREERFASVLDLKAALLEYEAREQSIDLAAGAAVHLERALQTQDYDDFSRARFGYEEALETWADNPSALEGLNRTRLEFARCAASRNDFELGLSLLGPDDAAHQQLHEQLTSDRETLLAQEQQLEEQRRARLRLRRSLMVTTVVALAVVASFAIFAEFKRRDAVEQRQLADFQKSQAEEQKAEALRQRADADQQRAIAEERRQAAEAASDLAKAQTKLAETSAAEAIRQRGLAEQQVYVSLLLRADNELKSDRRTDAARLLESIPFGRRQWEARYLTRQAQGTPLTLRGHNDHVKSIAVSSDGRRVASAGWDFDVKVWDLQSGEELLALRGHRSQVHSVAFSPDDERILSGSGDGTVRLWDSLSGALLQTIEHKGGVKCVAYSPDGLWTATGSSDKTVVLRNASAGMEHQVLVGHAGAVEAVAFSPDGSRVVSASADNTLKLWDTATGEELQTFAGHTSWVTCAAFSPDGRRIISGSGDKTARVWDTFTGKPLLILKTDELVLSAAFHPAGESIVTACGNYSQPGRVRIWSSRSGQELFTLSGHQSQINSVVFTPDGRQIVSGSGDGTINMWGSWRDSPAITFHSDEKGLFGLALCRDAPLVTTSGGDGTVRIYDTRTLQEKLLLTIDGERIESVAISPDGSRIAAGNAGGKLVVWDARSGAIVQEKVLNAGIAAIEFTRDSQRVIAGGGKVAEAGELFVWDVVNGKMLHDLSGHQDRVYSLAISPDGKWLVSGDFQGHLKLWNLESGAQEHSFQARGAVSGIAFSSDGDRLVSTFGDGIAVWSTGAKALLHKMRKPDEIIASVTLSPDGRRIITGTYSGILTFWDASSGSEVWSLKAHNGLIGRLMFTSDGQRFVSVSNDGTARIWDSRLDGESVLLRSHVNYISDMRISADGRFAVTGSHDQTASVWDLATGTERKVLGSHETYVTSVAISPDNRLVLTGSGQFGKPGFVRLWEIESGKELKRLKGHENLVSCVAFSRDGRLLGSGARGGIIKVWDADSGAELRSMNAPGDWPVDLAFSKDGKQIITRDVTDRWSAWDVTTGQPVDVEERPAAPDVIRDSNGSLFLTRSDSELRVVRRKPTGEVWRESSDRLAAWEPSWCERDATRYENAKNWLAAHFYLRRLSELKPEDEAVRSRLAHVVSMLEAETREEDRAAQGANDALPSQDQ